MALRTLTYDETRATQGSAMSLAGDGPPQAGELTPLPAGGGHMAATAAWLPP